jgi:hypothetical protein
MEDKLSKLKSLKQQLAREKLQSQYYALANSTKQNFGLSTPSKERSLSRGKRSEASAQSTAKQSSKKTEKKKASNASKDGRSSVKHTSVNATSNDD